MELRIDYLCRLSGALCNGSEYSIKQIMLSAIRNNVPIAHLREVILMSYLFDGFPTALEGFRILDDVTASDINTRDDIQWTADNLALWRERGEKLCRQVYGDKYESLMERVSNISPELKAAMLVEGYGKVLSRDTLPIVERELCIVAMLAVKNKPRQLESHALGALRCGALEADLQRVVKLLGEMLSPERCAEAGAFIDNVIHKFKKKQTCKLTS